MIKVVMRFTALLIGILFLISGILATTIVAINLGAILSLLVGLIFLSVFIFFKPIQKSIQTTKLGKVLSIFSAICIVFFLIVQSIIIASGQNHFSGKCDAVIVLGAGLKGKHVTPTLQNRLDRALEYLEKYPDTYLIVSGGQGPGEQITEAEAMQQYLTARRVSAHQIILEDKSTSTAENFQFSRTIIDELFADNNYTVCYTTNTFHTYRSGQIAKNQGLSVSSLPAKDVWYIAPTTYLREFLAVLKLWILGG